MNNFICDNRAVFPSTGTTDEGNQTNRGKARANKLQFCDGLASDWVKVSCGSGFKPITARGVAKQCNREHSLKPAQFEKKTS